MSNLEDSKPASKSLTNLASVKDLDLSLKETKSDTDLTLDDFATADDMFCKKEKDTYDLQFMFELNLLEREMLHLKIAGIEDKMIAIKNERSELESQLESAEICLSVLD